MNCDKCKKQIGPTGGETYYVCRCGMRYCYTCGFSRYKCDRCNQENQIESRRT